jgi:hypothetical protein
MSIRTDVYWWNLKDDAKSRGRNLCEFCRIRPIYDLHHRTYERKWQERLEDVMAVCRRCHEAIHFGGCVRAANGSLAASGDSGHGMTAPWLEYLKAHPFPPPTLIIRSTPTPETLR